MVWHPALNPLRDVLAELDPDVADARVVATGALLPLSIIPLQERSARMDASTPGAIDGMPDAALVGKIDEWTRCA